MGLIYVEGKVKAPGSRQRFLRVRLLLDSGAVYSVLRRNEWQALRLKPERELDFVLADGTTLSREASVNAFSRSKAVAQPLQSCLANRKTRRCLAPLPSRP